MESSIKRVSLSHPSGSLLNSRPEAQASQRSLLVKSNANNAPVCLPTGKPTSGDSRPAGDYDVLIALGGVVLLLSLRYLFVLISFHSPQVLGKKKSPPLVPYIIPLLGSLPLSYLWNPMKFVLSAK